MRFRMIIDKTAEEEVVATVHEPSGLTEKIEALVTNRGEAMQLVGYMEDTMRILEVSEIECVTVLEGKTYAIDAENRRYRLKQRLYELEELLPPSFIRINKSALANEKRLERFTASFSGAVDAIFRCGYREYVSRRCFVQIKRRFAEK